MGEKTYYCIECGREIHHMGKCLACNMEAKRKREAQEERKKEKGW